ncbi:unnamed protein product [Meganyctiphanes norvegica]|uniref:Uncharacterized protein n=1 Tax=Meganyctiphanes norvegica TaxID=48144 RepID=A0AAV2QS28_MEGNR
MAVRMPMSMTKQDRLKVNNEKAINEVGRGVLITACEVRLNGVPVIAKYHGLSHQDRDRFFNVDQRNEILAGGPLTDMDVSLLHAIIRAFGLGPGRLGHLLAALKNKRNKFEHNKHKLALDKPKLILKLTVLESLCIDILTELQNYCDPAHVASLNHKIGVIKTQFSELRGTIDDHLQEGAQALILAALNIETKVADAAAAITQMENAATNISTKTNDAATLITNAATNISTKTNDAATVITEAASDISNKTSDAGTVITQMENAAKDISTKTNDAAIVIAEAASDISTKTASAAETLTKFEVAANNFVEKKWKDDEVLASARSELIELKKKKRKIINPNTSKHKKKKWSDRELLESAKSEIIEVLSSTCKIQTAEGCTASPEDIMTEFLMLKVEKGELCENRWQKTNEIPYKSVLQLKTNSGKLADIILITGNVGIGKTTLSKYIGWAFGKDPPLVKGLAEFDIILYLECRDSSIKCLDDLLRNLFPRTIKDYNIAIEDFKCFIYRQKLLTVIDG